MSSLKTFHLTSSNVRCKLPGRSLIFSALIDSGNLSSYDLISESLTKKLNIPVNPAHLELVTAGKKIQVIGQCQPFNIYIEDCGEILEIAPYVVQGLNTNLNLGPAFLARANCDLKLRQHESPKQVIRNGEKDEIRVKGAVSVTNLPENVGKKDVKNLFSKFGNIAGVSLAKDKKTEKCAGLAFVNFWREEDGARAIAKMNGYRYGDNILNVTWAKEEHS